MIYLASRKLLFVKPKKTAGTSVEVALSCNATDDDIVTPLLEEDERIRWEQGGHFPVNWAWRKSDEAAYRARFEQYLKDGVVPRRYFGLRRGRLYNRLGAKFINHITPASVLTRAGQGFLDAAFMITMCRHPYEQVVSMAYHLQLGTEKPLQYFLERTLDRGALNDAYVFGPKAPDFVIRYEHLREDLAELEVRFDLTLTKNLPFTKHNARGDRRPAAEILTAEQRTRCRDLYRRTFEAFDYAP